MNTRERRVSIQEYVSASDFRAGFIEAWKGLPPAYDARLLARFGTSYEMGRQCAIWLRSTGRSGKRVPKMSESALRQMARECGLPKVVGINA